MIDDQNGFLDVQGFYDEAEAMLVGKQAKQNQDQVKVSKKKYIIVKEVSKDD